MRTNLTKTAAIISTIGIDIGKTTFHLVGLNKRGVIVLQQKVSRSQLARRLANVPRCLVGMEACSGAHHIGRQLEALRAPRRRRCESERSAGEDRLVAVVDGKEWSNRTYPS